MRSVKHHNNLYLTELLGEILYSLRFAVVECPHPSLKLTNCLIVHPVDFGEGAYVLANEQYLVTTKHDTTQKLMRGQVGVTSSQRQWIGLAIIGDQVTISPLNLPPSEIFLEELDIEIGFWKRTLEIAEQFSSDEIAKDFVRIFNGQIFVNFTVIELPQGEQRRGASAASMGLGVVMDRTEVSFIKAPDSRIKIKSNSKKPPPNVILAPNFKFEDMGIGGLDSEFGTSFCRALLLVSSRQTWCRSLEGLLLFDPPGTGKTLMARQIGKMLNAREAKIVNGPVILNKYVGASEENIRKLFADAETEYKAKGDESGLHTITFDELDAISAIEGRGSSFIMTNRLDMIDEALLRPGRLEVRMEISLPDEHGRLQILTIHTSQMRKNEVMDPDVNLKYLAAKTRNFSGAEISGLVKSATSFAFRRHVKVSSLDLLIAGSSIFCVDWNTRRLSEDVSNLRVKMEDFNNALSEVQPAFGVSEDEIQAVVQNGIYHYSEAIQLILHDGSLFVEQVRASQRTPRVTILRHGPSGSGKTALAATSARTSDYPFIKLISADNMVGFSESHQISAITKVFADSYKSSLSVLVLDNIERLIGWAPVGPRFSLSVIQALLGLLQKAAPKGRRRLIIATYLCPPITSLDAMEKVLEEVNLFSHRRGLETCMGMMQQAYGSRKLQIGIKKLLNLIEMARQEPEDIGSRLVRAIVSFGI
ncbi:hypothetical protein M422DRAFT_240970 [Sphaerobolus stellatus SS14]|nr:hypothetical protein M422DRAFT_240970 [Sphaerobolus stellatus SS14]